VVLLGEIGGLQEQQAAEVVAAMEKPVIAFLAGRSAPADRRMGHAGAIITGVDVGWEAKRRLLTEAGAIVVDTPAQVPKALADQFSVGDKIRSEMA
jgi:succinyl-CoA synthetase alpha subunit